MRRVAQTLTVALCERVLRRAGALAVESETVYAAVDGWHYAVSEARAAYLSGGPADLLPTHEHAAALAAEVGQ
jgi:hypothetical protein